MIEYKLEGLEDLLKKLQNEELLGKPLYDFFGKVALLVKGKVQTNTPVDTGRLRQGIQYEIDAKPVPLFAKVATNVTYAPFVELDTRPHFPPPDALMGWGSRHGFTNIFVLCRAIAMKGTKGRHMFKKGLEESKSGIERLLSELARMIREQWER